jgi:hypothetical protein
MNVNLVIVGLVTMRDVLVVEVVGLLDGLDG